MNNDLIAATLSGSTGRTAVATSLAAAELIAAIVSEMKKEGGFTLLSFGTFTVRKTKAQSAEPAHRRAGQGRQDCPLQGQPKP